MTKQPQLRAPLLRMTVTAALLAVPALAVGQTSSTPGATPGAMPGTSTMQTPGAATMPTPGAATMPTRQGDATAPAANPGAAAGGQMPPTMMPGAGMPSTAMPGAGMPGASMPGATTAAPPTGTTPNPGRSMPSMTAAPPASPSSGTSDMTGAASPRSRMSELIGSAIYNDRDEKIGDVDDVLAEAASGGTGAMAVVQIGGFLGLGGRLVTVPLRDLRWNAERERLMLPGASKEALQSRPAFEYAARRG